MKKFILLSIFSLLLSCEPDSQSIKSGAEMKKWSYGATIDIVIDSFGDPTSNRIKSAFVTIEGDANSWKLIDSNHKSNRVDGVCSLYEGKANKVEVKCVDMQGQVGRLFLHTGNVTVNAHVSHGRVLAERQPMDILHLELLPFRLDSELKSAEFNCTLGRYELGMLKNEKLPVYLGNDEFDLTDVSLTIDGSQYFYGLADHTILQIPGE